ncbi:MAG: hypothetical protein ACJAXY_001126 [Nonlabens sp.]|jgi:hypothetical protein
MGSEIEIETSRTHQAKPNLYELELYMMGKIERELCN